MTIADINYPGTRCSGGMSRMRLFMIPIIRAGGLRYDKTLLYIYMFLGGRLWVNFVGVTDKVADDDRVITPNSIPRSGTTSAIPSVTEARRR